EEDGIELLAELVRSPVLKALHFLDREKPVPKIAEHAGGGAPDPEIAQGFEGAQRIGVELALVIDAAHPRTLDEVVGQDLVPQIHDLFALREEAMATDVEPIAFVLHCAADATNVGGILLDDRNGFALLGEQIA